MTRADEAIPDFDLWGRHCSSSTRYLVSDNSTGEKAFQITTNSQVAALLWIFNPNQNPRKNEAVRGYPVKANELKW